MRLLLQLSNSKPKDGLYLGLVLYCEGDERYPRTIVELECDHIYLEDLTGFIHHWKWPNSLKYDFLATYTLVPDGPNLKKLGYSIP